MNSKAKKQKKEGPEQVCVYCGKPFDEDHVIVEERDGPYHFACSLSVTDDPSFYGYDGCDS